MATHPKGKRPFGLPHAKPFTKTKNALAGRKSIVTTTALSSEQRVLDNTPSLQRTRELLDRPLP